MKNFFRIILKKIWFSYLRIVKGGISSFGFESFGKYSVLSHPMRIIGKKYVTIGDNCWIMDGLRLEVWDSWGGESAYKPYFQIGSNVRIQQNCHFTCANKIIIGDGTSILPHVLITDIEHIKENGKSINDTGIRTGEVIIGSNCVIGMGARIMANGKSITIGNDAVIGANAVVVSDIPNNSVAVGIPAKVKSRNE